MKKIYILAGLLATFLIALLWHKHAPQDIVPLDGTPVHVTLSGTYVCLPFIDTKAPTSGECVFGLKTDDGVYYMVNFGQSAQALEQFDKRAHITALGFVVIKETLNTDHWAPYNMKGIFTITKMVE